MSGVTAVLNGVWLLGAEQPRIDWPTTRGQQQLVRIHTKAQQDNIWIDGEMQ